MEIKSNNTKENSNDFYTLLCPVELFRYFFRKTFKDVEISNEECDEIGEEFYKYLRGLNLTEEQKKNILPKNIFDVILNADHPFKTNGFEPAYVFHFTEFVAQQKQKAISEGYSPNGHNGSNKNSSRFW